MHRWSRAELALSGLLLAIAAVAWVLTHQLSEPGMRIGVLTGAAPMSDAMRPPVLAVALFPVTWWMAAIAAIVAMEKLHHHGELIGRALGGLFLVAGLALLVAPTALSATS